MNQAGSTPATRQSAASVNIAARDQRSVSTASRATALRGRPRNVTPNALTKHAAASAAESASSAPIAGTRNLSSHWGRAGLKRIAWKVSHSETKPLKGGSAEIAAEPTRKRNA